MPRIFMNDDDKLEDLAAAMGCSPHDKSHRRIQSVTVSMPPS
jgi:hypothetical protein